MTDVTEPESQWTASAKEAYAARAEELVAALREHVKLTMGRSGRQSEHPHYFASTEEFFRAAAAFDDAEFEWCGTFPLRLDSDEADGDIDYEEEDEEVDGSVLTLVGRWDYRVMDAHALIATGRAAYARCWPDDTDEDAAIAVADPAAAAQEIAHADGWHALEEADGLRPIASTTTVILHEDASTAWLEDEEDPFAITREG
ncbi:MAG: hypothetical protein QOD39_1120 [Mycobacterium sp.]|jgi:hypothetical protein|nr:hypothetical protein [Mycobacterium sp.]